MNKVVVFQMQTQAKKAHAQSHMTIGQNAGEYAVGWFTLSLINSGLAQSKGRSGLLWWFVSLFFGPICTLLIVMLDPVKPKA